MADQVRIQGNVHSWGSIIVKIDGERFTGFSSISYSDKRERVYQWGMGQHQAPRGRSRGKYTPGACKLGGPPSSIQILREALSDKAPDQASYGNVSFEVVVQYIDVGEKPIQIVLQDCVWISNDTSNEEGADPLKEEFEFMPMLITRNGVILADATEGLP